MSLERRVRDCLRRYMEDGAAKELRRLRGLPRYEADKSEILGLPVSFSDAASFLSAREAIFVKQLYDFGCAGEQPYIIDGGANIGLATLFWKSKWPAAEIVAFEPNPVSLVHLQKNLLSWGLSDVTVHKMALAGQEGEVLFENDEADAGRVLRGVAREGLATVKAVRLSPFLDRPVSLLKLDIEGGETEVLQESAQALGSVRRIFVEYHSLSSIHPQRIAEMLGILIDAGFRICIQPEYAPPRPLQSWTPDLGMDNRLNIFGSREPR